MLYALAACQFVHFASAMLLFGASTMAAILQSERYGWGSGLDAALQRGLLAAALVALVSAGGWLLLEAAAMGGPWGDALRPRIVRIVLTDTEFGYLWRFRLPLALAICLLVWIGRRALLALAVLSAGLLATLALTGHAVMHTGWLGLGHELNQATHLLAAGLWLGGLVPLGMVLARALRGPIEASAANGALHRFSDVALVAVLLLLGSGVVNAWMLVGNWPALVTSDYGRTLLTKLAFVATMMTLALYNRLWLLPALPARRHLALARLERDVVIELVLGAIVVGVASLLGNLPPPGMEH